MTTKQQREEAAQLTRRFQQARADRELVILEGFHALKHALRFGGQVEAIVSHDREELCRLAQGLAGDVADEIEAGAEIVSRKVFRQLGPYEPHTGVVSIARRRAVDASALLAERENPAPLILLDDPRHRGNMGAVVRVAAAAQAAGVLTIGAYDPWDPVSVRGSAGLHFAVPVAQLPQLPPLDRPLLALDPDGVPLHPGEVPPRALLAFGSERHGLSDELLQRADARVSLPMRAGVSSLNLATSVAAVLYSLRLCAQAD